ncbi:hypothetical protein KCU90_g7754, partial [Aureobasidium melanogenum]
MLPKNRAQLLPVPRFKRLQHLIMIMNRAIPLRDLKIRPKPQRLQAPIHSNITSSAAVIRSAASSPEKASRPLINSKVSRNSASDIFDTDAPRFGEISISPSAASTFNASRNGVREIPSVSHSSRSFSFLPGSSTPSTIKRRMCSTTVSCKR